MGFVPQGWVGQSRGKMPLPRFYWQPWERHLAAIHLLIAAGRRSHGRRSHAALRCRSVPLPPKRRLGAHTVSNIRRQVPSISTRMTMPSSSGPCPVSAYRESKSPRLPSWEK